MTFILVAFLIAIPLGILITVWAEWEQKRWQKKVDACIYCQMMKAIRAAHVMQTAMAGFAMVVVKVAKDFLNAMNLTTKTIEMAPHPAHITTLMGMKVVENPLLKEDEMILLGQHVPLPVEWKARAFEIAQPNPLDVVNEITRKTDLTGGTGS